MTAIGFVGLGAMGSRMAGRLLEGNDLYGTNRTAAKAADLVGHGMTWCDTPREVAEAADVVFTTEGTLAIMAGGPAEALRVAEPLLLRLGRTVTHVGGNGQALLLKLAINISLAAQMLAFSEGVLLAERGGIDRALAARVMAGSAIGSPMLQARAPLMLDLPEQAWFDVQLMHKDIRLVLEAAHLLGAPASSARAADGVLSRAEELGYARRDIAALLEVLARTAEMPARRARPAMAAEGRDRNAA